jgi:hypothetical protein
MPVNCPPHPPIGPTGDTTDSIIKMALVILGILSTAGTIIGMVTHSTDVSTVPILGITGKGVGSIGLSAVAAAVAVVVLSAAYWYDRCWPKTGMEACSAGVIDDIQPAFNDAISFWAPFTAQHNMVSVVTQCQYWPLIEQDAGFIYVNPTDNSPEIHCYFKTPEVCAAELGSFVGAVAGGIAGIVLGIIAGAALGCAGTGPAYAFCLIAACLIAALIAAALALFGAALGGNLGEAIASSSGLHTDSGANPSVGDYVTTCGQTIIYGNDQHARVYWFVEHSALHGHSMAQAGQQWTHTDPDTDMPLDTCQKLCPGTFTGIPTGDGSVQ